MRIPFCFLAALLCQMSAPTFGETPNTAPEIEMWKLVNQDRAKHKLAPLTLDPRISEMARKHSQDMADNDFFGHTSPTTGEPGDRFFKTGLAAMKLAENVAHHRNVKEAEEGLMNSPGHRKNLLDPDFTHIGIGIVPGQNGQIYVTQNFSKPISEVDVSQSAEKFVERLNEERKAKLLPPVVADADLGQACQANSEDMAKQQELGTETVKSFLKKRSFRSYKLHVYLCDSPEKLWEVKGLFESSTTHVGLGMVRNEKTKDKFGMLWITVVIAQGKI